jgi:hypothetical protein
VRGALACDEPGRPPGFDGTLRAAAGAGGYPLTHAALALGIEQELGCDPTGGDALRAEIVDALRRAVAADTTVDDAAVERVAILTYLGEGDAVPRSRLDAVAGAARRHGGLPGPDVATRQHTTALAIWSLAARVLPARTGATIVPPG